MTSALPDLLSPGMRIVFCGTAAGSKSAAVGAYYADPRNRFWRVLAHVGLTPRRLMPEEFRLLPSYGIGLTDLAKMHSGVDTAIPATAYDVNGFVRRIERAAPAVVAFNGKLAAAIILGRPRRSVSLGKQRECIGNTAVFVLPSTSGAGGGHWDIGPWREVARFVVGLA